MIRFFAASGKERLANWLEARDAVASGDNLYIIEPDGLHVTSLSPKLQTRYEVEAAGSTIRYSVEWKALPSSEEVSVKAFVTAGRTSIVGMDLASNHAVVEWTLPPSTGDHEIIIAVGNQHYFISTKDRLRVR